MEDSLKVPIHEAKAHLSKLVARALAGEEVIIYRGKVPAVRLVPAGESRGRIFGALKEKISVGKEFFDPLSDEELSSWE